MCEVHSIYSIQGAQFTLSVTPLIAWYTERQSSRKGTLMIGLLALAWSQILLMESREYWIMAVARVLQGVSATVVWTAGLALM
jgi:MFS transporter, DHA1 family, solute carrier family 18 (vesicular amine transporter), member 1/2